MIKGILKNIKIFPYLLACPPLEKGFPEMFLPHTRRDSWEMVTRGLSGAVRLLDLSVAFRPGSLSSPLVSPTRGWKSLVRL